MTGLGLLQQLQKIAFNFFPALTGAVACKQSRSLHVEIRPFQPFIHCVTVKGISIVMHLWPIFCQPRNFHRVGVKEKEIVAHRTGFQYSFTFA